MPFTTTIWPLAVALAIGILLGSERERRKGTGPARGAAGLRTFALVALLGALAASTGEPILSAVAGLFVAGAALLSYWRARGDDDPGLTTEAALMVAFVLGALAPRHTALAAGVGVVVTALLAARAPLHAFVRERLTEREFRDALTFAAAALVVLPLMPDRALGPYGAFNPFTVWRLVVVVMSVNGAGYLALRLVGARFGLPLSGFIAGFVSSAATVAALGGRAKADGRLLAPAVGGAVLSTVATVVQLALVVGVVSAATLRALAPALGCAAVAAAGYGLVFTGRAIRSPADAPPDPGRPFDLRAAVILAATVSVILLASAALLARFGEAGLVAATALGGFADTHAAAIAATAAVAREGAPATAAVLPILAGFTTNAATKAIVAVALGSRRYAAQVCGGLALVVAAAWAGLLLG
jgi:uncharacterized membrane protein (DUF4010 family)